MRNKLKQLVESEVRKLEPSLSPQSDTFKTAAVMLAALRIGPSADNIRKALGYRFDFVNGIKRNLVKAGIWKNGKTYASWDGENGGIAFWCDVAVAQGLLARA